MADDDRRNGVAAPPRDVSTPEARAELVAYWRAREDEDRAAGTGRFAPGGVDGPPHPDDPTPEELAAERYAWNLAEEVKHLRLRRDAFQVLAAEDMARPRALGIAEFLAEPCPELLVEGLLYRDSLARIYGPPSTCKSFLALDLALRLALGLSWCGRAARQGPVIYVMAEGSRVNVARLRAWLAHHRVDPDDLAGRFYAVPEAVQLTEVGVREVVKLAAEIGAVLTIFDTKNACMIGEENSATDTATMRRALDAVRRASAGCVTLIDHTGYDQGKARGSSAATAMLDTEVSVQAEDGRVSVRVTRDKAAAAGLTRELELVPVGREAVLVPAMTTRPAPAVATTGVVVPPTPEDWQTAETSLPADVWNYAGPGEKGVRDLAKLMVHETSRAHGDPRGVGLTRAEAQRELGKIGTPTTTVRRAWSALLDLGRLRSAQGVSDGHLTGRHVWVAKAADDVTGVYLPLPTADLAVAPPWHPPMPDLGGSS